VRLAKRHGRGNGGGGGGHTRRADPLQTRASCGRMRRMARVGARFDSRCSSSNKNNNPRNEISARRHLAPVRVYCCESFTARGLLLVLPFFVIFSFLDPCGGRSHSCVFVAHHEPPLLLASLLLLPQTCCCCCCLLPPRTFTTALHKEKARQLLLQFSDPVFNPRSCESRFHVVSSAASAAARHRAVWRAHRREFAGARHCQGRQVQGLCCRLEHDFGR
jgi:hypothetical protein